MSAEGETITEAELAGAIARRLHRIRGSANLVLSDPAATAADIFAEALAGREYKPGAYEDAEGNLYMRVAGLKAWLRVMDDGTTEVRPDDGWIERPLRRLVPEGSREAAVVLVTEWRGLGEQDHAVPPWRDGYRAALRKCADELEYALKHGGDL